MLLFATANERETNFILSVQNLACELHFLWPVYGMYSTNDFCYLNYLLPLAETKYRTDNATPS